MSYLNFKSKYDRFPVIKISNNQDDLIQGYGPIIDTLQNIKKGVVVFETYPGIDQKILLEKVIKPLNPNQIIFSEDYTISEEEYDTLVDPHLYDDRVFGLYSHHHKIEDFYRLDDLKKVNDSIDHNLWFWSISF